MFKTYAIGSIVASGLVVFIVQSNERAKAQSIALDKQLAEVRSQTSEWMQTTERAVRTLEGRTLSEQATSPRDTSAVVDEKPNDSSEKPSLGTGRRQRARDLEQGLRERFAAGERQKSTPRQTALERALAAEDLKNLTWQTECRDKLCRVEIQLGEGQESMSEYEQIVSSVPWEGRAFSRIDMKTRAGTIYLEPAEEAL